MIRNATLAKLDTAKRAIIEAKSLQDVKEIRDQAESLRVYSKQAKDSLELQNYCAEIKIRAERRAGEMINEMPKKQGARGVGKKVDLHDESPLASAGITHVESHRWQRVASVPEEQFEAHLAEVQGAKRELTTASVLKIANILRPKNGAVTVEKHKGDFIGDLSALAGKTFGCLYVDPPWRYANQGTRASTDNHYSTMTVDEICALPVKDLAAPKSHLHLWTTNAFLFECPKIFDAWGFDFKSSFVWVKPQMGIGNYWRNSHEILLLGVRGGLVGQAKNLMSWARIDRAMHSAKPEAIRTMVERLSPGPYLELFGRRLVRNWTVFGNELLPSQQSLEVA